MGQTLTSAARWTKAGEGPRGSLEITPTNEIILNNFIQFAESFCSSYPEQAKIVFKQPLTWSSELQPSDIPNVIQKGDEYVSDSVDQDGQPLIRMTPRDDHHEISLRSFECIDQVLRSAGDKKMSETRACLEAHPDPVARMMGERFATIPDTRDNAMMRYIDEVLKSVGEQRGGGGMATDEEGQVEQSSSLDTTKAAELKMLVILQEFDTATLQEAVKKISETIKLSPSDVERALNQLKPYCGPNEENDLLESIGYVAPFDTKFPDGCRAPPWRQVVGDICYIQAKPHGEDIIYITATTSGYINVKGFSGGSKEFQHEQEGQHYRELTTLLQEKNSSFAENVQQQDFFKTHEKKKDKDAIEPIRASERREDSGRDDQDQKGYQADDEGKKKDKKKQKDQEKKKKMATSLKKWGSLDMEEEKKEKDDKKKVKVQHKKSHTARKTQYSDAEDSFEESSSESEEEEETPDRRNEANSDLPSEYWQIQKLVKYLKGGNQTATIIALCAMRDFNLQQETCQLAIRDVGGLEVLINLLDTDAVKCKIGSLKILKEISKNTQIRRAIADLGGLQTMVQILRDPNKDLKCLAAETIANVAKFRRARRTVRQHGGIKKLVALLDCTLVTTQNPTPEQEKDIDVARCGALALWSCSKSTRNKQAMRKAGAIPLLAKLLKSPHENMLIPVVGTLQECATEPSYRLAIRTEGMIEDLVKNLKSENQELEMHCASAIFKCAEEKETRDLVRQYGGLDPLVKLLNNGDNKELLAAATGAIWKCAISPENVERFQELKAIDLLVALLNDQPEEVLVNVVGAIAELAKDPPNRLTIRKAGGIPPLVNLLTGTNQALLVNVTKAVGQCAEEPENMTVIDKLDGVRLLWSLLKNPNPEVQASAAWAICPCIENAKDAGEMVRSFVGGLELIVSLLKQEDEIEVLASVCAAIANIANDEENLAVITDHGVVPMLARLTYTQNDDKLRRHLAEAIARCCSWGNNRVAFGEKGAVAPLVKYLKSGDKVVHRSTARALHQLSKHPNNCITMHEAGVVKSLMEMVGSEDDILQEASAGCIANIRRLALANEKARNK